MIIVARKAAFEPVLWLQLSTILAFAVDPFQASLAPFDFFTVANSVEAEFFIARLAVAIVKVISFILVATQSIIGITLDAVGENVAATTAAIA